VRLLCCAGAGSRSSFGAWRLRLDGPKANKWGTVGVDVIITLGVAGEILFSRKARALSERLRIESEERIAALNEQTAEANKKAAEANDRASQTYLLLEVLRRQTSRRIPDRGAMLKTLAAGPRGKVEIMFAQEDSDSAVLAEVLRQILSEAEWACLSVTPWHTIDLLNRFGFFSSWTGLVCRGARLLPPRCCKCKGTSVRRVCQRWERGDVAYRIGRRSYVRIWNS
jgi:hypothetical protein